MNVIVFEAERWEMEAFASLATANRLIAIGKPLGAKTLSELEPGLCADAEIISTFIYSELDRATLQRFPRLKMIATRSTGFDHIDLDYCRAAEIRVANVPSYGENTVAEHVFALLLAISHHLVEAVDRTRRGDFSQQGLCGFDLQGKTLGVIGTGSIGRHVARIARGFEMNVLAYDVHPNDEAAHKIGFAYASLNVVLESSDVISLHVPGGAATRNLVSHAAFERMKQGVVLINTARGTVVDSRALLRAIATGKVSAVGLDVLAEEPVVREEAELLRSAYSRKHDLEALLADHILLRLRNVIITPHSAFNTREAVGRILETTCANISAFLAGAPRNIVV